MGRNQQPTMYLDLKKKVGDPTAVFTDADRIRALEKQVFILRQFAEKVGSVEAFKTIERADAIGAYLHDRKSDRLYKEKGR